MDTFTNPDPTTPEPAPTRDGREAPSRRRMLATSVAVAGLTATGGLAVILSTAATSGTADTGGAAPAQQGPVATGTTSVPNATAVPTSTTTPGTTVPNTTQNAGVGRFGGQPPQVGLGGAPGHASSGGS